MRKRILIVDSEAGVLRTLGYALESEGYNVVTAVSGEEALAVVNDELPHLVILERTLPGISGIDVCRKLRSSTQIGDLPILMLGSQAVAKDRIFGLKAGADDYVAKPVDTYEIVARVQALLGRSERLLQTLPCSYGQTIGVIGAKGGVGTTTLAVNTAVAFSSRGSSTILLELRPFYGTCAKLLGHAAPPNLSELLSLEPAHINAREVRKRLVHSHADLSALFGPQKEDGVREIGPDHAEAVIDGLSHMAERIVIDLPCHFTEATRAAIKRCDCVVIVADRNDPDWISAGSVLRQLSSLELGRGQMGLVIVNHSVLSRQTNPSEIRMQLQCDVLGVVPPAEEICLAAEEAGQPFMAHNATSAIAGAVSQITERLENLMHASLV